ncbi:hypothetical protein Pan216_30020 [Planctomycetes bacterium Pan216]|uniref:Uncharacterized protein n=1 Tax=Kolteria novifilia TaxID=2527975 RepID=A0A518B598_9BACT|nr:hypothetical protein Pan216_30020 [Planctomycetes bacterium Pan216]
MTPTTRTASAATTAVWHDHAAHLYTAINLVLSVHLQARRHRNADVLAKLDALIAHLRRHLRSELVQAEIDRWLTIDLANKQPQPDGPTIRALAEDADRQGTVRVPLSPDQYATFVAALRWTRLDPRMRLPHFVDQLVGRLERLFHHPAPTIN